MSAQSSGRDLLAPLTWFFGEKEEEEDEKPKGLSSFKIDGKENVSTSLRLSGDVDADKDTHLFTDVSADKASSVSSSVLRLDEVRTLSADVCKGEATMKSRDGGDSGAIIWKMVNEAISILKTGIYQLVQEMRRWFRRRKRSGRKR